MPLELNAPLPPPSPPLPSHESKISELAIISICCSGLGLVIGFFCCIGLILAIAGIVCGLLALMDIKKKPYLKGKEFAWIGVGLGGAAILVYILMLVLGMGMVVLSGLAKPH